MPTSKLQIQVERFREVMSIRVQLIENPTQPGLNDKKLHNVTQQESRVRVVARHSVVRALAPFL